MDATRRRRIQHRAQASTQSVILAVLAGQSNMIGVNTADGVDADSADVYQYGGNSANGATYQLLVTDITPLQHKDNTIFGPGPGNNLLAKLKTQNPGAKIVAVPVATGGTAMAGGGGTPTWQSSATPGSGGVNFEFMVNQANAARAAALVSWPTAVFTVKIFIIQGEADAVLAVAGATYLTAFNNFVANARTRITGAGSAQVIVGSMLPELWTVGSPVYSADYATINRQHVSASVDLTGVLYVKGPTDDSDDNLHYRPASVARALGDNLGNAITDATGPTMTTSATANNTVSTVLSIPLTCNDTHATYHLDGGAGVANFEISDRYLSPVLRWTGNGTGPAVGDYVVGVRARDGSGNYGATLTITVTVAVPASEPLTYRASGGVVPPFAFDYTFTGLTTYSGKKNIIMLSCQGVGTAPVVTLGGDAMTLVASTDSGGANAMYCYEVVPASGGSGKSLVVASSFVGGSGGGQIAYDLFTAGNAATFSVSQGKVFDFAADPQVTPSLTIPAGGFGIVLVGANSSTGITPNSGLTEVSDRVAPTNRIGAYTMAATGTPSVNIGTTGCFMLAVAYSA